MVGWLSGHSRRALRTTAKVWVLFKTQSSGRLMATSELYMEGGKVPAVRTGAKKCCSTKSGGGQALQEEVRWEPGSTEGGIQM